MTTTFDFRHTLLRLAECRRLINISPTPVRLPCAHRDEAVELRHGAKLGLAQALTYACNALEIARIRAVHETPSDATPLERIVWKHALLDGWDKSAALDEVSVVAAVASVQREGIVSLLQKRTVLGARGARLDVYTAGPRDRPAWVQVLPYGIPAELTYLLAREVAKDYRFVTFEGPDLLASPDEFDQLRHGIDATVEDLVSVLDALDLPRAHVAGLCAGAMPALRLAHLHPERVSSLILGNGAYATKPTSPLDFIALAERIGGQRGKAKVFFRFMAAQDLGGVEPEVPHLTMLPYSNPDLLYNFTTAFKQFYDRDLDSELEQWLAAVSCPSLIVVGECDRITPPAGSHRVASKLRNARLLSDPVGTHLSLLRAPQRSLVDAMLTFCREHDPSTTRPCEDSPGFGG